MYGKIFESIYDGSLYGEFEAIVVFKAMIVLADENGQLDMSPQSIAGRTSYPLEIVKNGLSVLQKPDPDSRQPGHEGRRIIPLENGRAFGWQIVNYQYYRNLASREAKKEADRVRIAEKRSKDKASSKINNVAGCRNVSQNVADVAHTDTDTDTDINTISLEQSSKPFVLFPLKTGDEHSVYEDQIAEWQDLYPAVDVRQELRSMRGWLLSNPRKRKTKRGVSNFVTSWLTRTLNTGGDNEKDRRSGKPDTRTALDRWEAKLNAGELD